jgi:acetyl/propionyl-CoA carboxylase alpha subunit
MIRILTDCARNHYVIKTADNWNEDKAGVKFSEYIVKPLLVYIAELMDKYYDKISQVDIKTGKTNEESMEHMTKLYNCVTFIKGLNNNIFVQPILKELAPYLRYLSSELNLDVLDDVLEENVESNEKLEELKLLQEDLINIVKNNNSDNSDDSKKSEDSRKSTNSKKKLNKIKKSKYINSEESSESSDSDNSDDLRESRESENKTRVYIGRNGKTYKIQLQ